MKKYNSFLPINLGTGQDILIKKLAILISQKIGYKGKILWNYKMPDGMPRKILNISKLSNLGFKCKINLNNGIDKSIDEYKKLSK
jgi:GDP-L-fucose synthase